jgi:hypothetical protein
LSPIKKLVHRVWWWVVSRLYPPTPIGGIGYMEVSEYTPEQSERIRNTLAGAMRELAQVDGGFSDAVTSQLRMVVAMRVAGPPIAGAAVWVRAYISRFDGAEATSARALACRLLWAAVYTKLHIEADRMGVVADETSIRQACFEEEVRFVKNFENWPDWLEYIQRDQP